MTARFVNRVRRLDALLAKIPCATGQPADHYPDVRVLLARLAHEYTSSKGATARIRMLQRDLDELVRQEHIAVVNPATKPFRYCRISPYSDDAIAREFTIRQIHAACSELIQDAPLSTLLDRFGSTLSDSLLPMDRIRILSDGLRLVPASVRPGVMSAVLEALVRGTTLSVAYRDAAGKRTFPLVHPQALLQRGPRIYLYALKEDEEQPVRQYALNRIIRATVGSADAKIQRDFHIDEAIRSGIADFASGEHVLLTLRARGYVAELLHDCALGPDQKFVDEPVDSDFDVCVSAVVPNTGQLLRWLLGCGDKIEVLTPVELRNVIRAQAVKAAQLYESDLPPTAE